jgi:hypothetical protein
MVFAFPYHDPNGIYNEVFKKNIPLLKQIFNYISISVTPATKDQNADFLKVLKKSGFDPYYNKQGTSLGDHFRGALESAIYSGDNEGIYFGFIDRLLYTLEKFKQEFTLDINQKAEKGLLVFERSNKAWETHPSNYYFAEHLVIEAYNKLLNREIDLNFCGLIIDKISANKILRLSVCESYNIAGEWILLSLLNSIPLKTKKVDWLSWEDPFWEKNKVQELKKIRENNPTETYKRLVIASGFMKLIQEERFKKLFSRM